MWADRINSIDQSDILIAESHGQFRFLKITEKEITEASKIKVSYANKFNEAKAELKVKSNKIRIIITEINLKKIIFKDGRLMIIDPDKRSSITEIDYLSKRNEILITSGGEIDRLLCMLDAKHILVTIKR